MRAATILLSLLILQAFAFSATIYIPDDHATIQAGLAAAANGDTIIVRPGIYVGKIDFLGKAVVLQSEMGPKSTVIDGKYLGSVVTFQQGEGAGSVLAGFTITNGRGTTCNDPPPPWYAGGGIFCAQSSPTITGNIITGNHAPLSVLGNGGGIYCFESSPTITNNVIADNTVWECGRGGGIYCGFYSAPAIIGNLIRENHATDGAGIACVDYSSPAITNNVIMHNDSPFIAGGIVCDQYSSPVITNNTIAQNRGCWYASGIWGRDSSPTIINTILWGNYPNFKQYHFSGGDPKCSYSDVQHGAPGEGNIEADPLLVDLHISYDSPCRNAGYNPAVSEAEDGEGDPRIVDGIVDIGADEYWFHLYPCQRAVAGEPIKIRTVGMPGDPVTLALGSGIKDPPQPTQYGDLFLILPPVWKGSIGIIPAEGILTLEATVPASWAAGDKMPFQALVGPQGDPASRLTNLMALDVE